MNNNLMSICYEGESGVSDIRTCHHDGILHVSLRDIFSTLNKENVLLNEKHSNTSLAGMILSQLQDLDKEEYINIPVKNASHDGEDEVFVTQPGLYRVMSTNKSKAGKKFQKWLYHEVIPSITKHGCYPPPITPQGSALSQMAEILAQNSRALADAIVRQDKLEDEVNNVKEELGSVSKRVSQIESDGPNKEYVITVKEQADKINLILSSEKEMEIVAWCENLNLSRGKFKINCPSGVREKTRYEVEIINEAISLVNRANS